jgi:uncharacterized protein (TIGR03118 family)
MTIARRALLLLTVVLASFTCAPTVVYADDDDDGGYLQTNLVSDLSGVARVTDPNLKNPWGITFIPGSPFWISDNGTGVSTLYNGKGDIVPLVVQIPPPKGSPSSVTATPTGIVWNPTQNFTVGTSTFPGIFIFATEDGTISAWNPNVDRTHAILEVDNAQAGAVYKGLALAPNRKGVFLFATNFHADSIDVFDATFKPAHTAGGFVDRHIPPGYAPFGIALIDGDLFVTYALQNAAKHDDVAGEGHGFVDIFDTDGHLLRRFASRGQLNSPWGVTRASHDFGKFSGDIVIGNFGDGHITAFGSNGDPRGQLRDRRGHVIAINGLWGLRFGGAAISDPSVLYFTAGLNDEADGLFGSVEATRSEDH